MVVVVKLRLMMLRLRLEGVVEVVIVSWVLVVEMSLETLLVIMGLSMVEVEAVGFRLVRIGLEEQVPQVL
jgi:hypothetical protein